MVRTGEQLQTPVALIIFNRPGKTQRVFEQIRLQRPQELFIIADGPRIQNTADIALVAESREIVNKVDWPCQVTTIYSEENLGCRKRIVTGLSQVFDQVAKAIVLEDDCLPHPDFFPFATELLDRFMSEPRVFSIGGHIWEFPDRHGGDSYFFSKYFSSWGWATWADRWSLVDPDMSHWPSIRETPLLRNISETPLELVYWLKTLDMTYGGTPELLQAWDYAVQLTMWEHNKLAIRPRVNLIQNIGLDAQATHTTVNSPAITLRQSMPLTWPLSHPENVARDKECDQLVNNLRVGGSLRKLMSDRS